MHSLARVPARRRPLPIGAALGACALVAGLALIPEGRVHAADPAVFAAHGEGSTAKIDHHDWTVLLRAMTTVERGVTKVAYKGLDRPSREALSAYVAFLQTVPVGEFNRDEQLAFWLNLHNAATIEILVEEYPGRTLAPVRSLPKSAGGPFAEKRLTVAGVALSVEDIVQSVLRPNWKDPLYHYGLAYGAVGGPNLARKAFTGPEVHAQLEEQARSFVNRGGADVRRGKLTVSSLYEWYRADFGADDAALIDHLRRFASDEMKQDLAGITSISKHDFDWALNAYTPRAPQIDRSSGGFGNTGFGGIGGGGGS